MESSLPSPTLAVWPHASYWTSLSYCFKQCWMDWSFAHHPSFNIYDYRKNLKFLIFIYLGKHFQSHFFKSWVLFHHRDKFSFCPGSIIALWISGFTLFSLDYWNFGSDFWWKTFLISLHWRNPHLPIVPGGLDEESQRLPLPQTMHVTTFSSKHSFGKSSLSNSYVLTLY